MNGGGSSPRFVLDASAVLALLHDEPGGERVLPMLDGAAMSTVNWSEVLQRYEAEGLALDGRREQIESLGVELRPFDARQAELAAELYSATRGTGLGIADRACLALAIDLEAEAVTADRSWGGLEAPALSAVSVNVIR